MRDSEVGSLQSPQEWVLKRTFRVAIKDLGDQSMATVIFLDEVKGHPNQSAPVGSLWLQQGLFQSRGTVPGHGKPQTGMITGLWCRRKLVDRVKLLHCTEGKTETWNVQGAQLIKQP